MAGSALNLTVRYDDRQILRAMRRLQDAAGDMTPALRDIGEHLLLSHDERFRAQVDPEGRPWAPLSPGYQRRKKHNKDKILVLRTHLSGLLRYQVGNDALRFGTDRIYGASHQFGDPRRNIPARPFLGLSGEDQTVILEILQDHVEMALRG